MLTNELREELMSLIIEYGGCLGYTLGYTSELNVIELLESDLLSYELYIYLEQYEEFTLSMEGIWDTRNWSFKPHSNTIKIYKEL